MAFGFEPELIDYSIIDDLQAFWDARRAE